MTAAFKTLLDRYDLFDTLGEGGFGTVYAARDRTTGRRLALKALTRGSPSALSRFKQEFRAVQEVHHPNLVRLEALVEDSGQWLIAMELVEGTDLLSYVRPAGEGQPVEEGRLRDAFRQLAEGLRALHVAGYVHRDLKPSNVRVTTEGRVVLLDFGLATSLDGGESAQDMAGLGTVAYMAPEQVNEGAVSAKADWYAFGVCLYEAVTGLLPLSASSALELLVMKQKSRPLPPSAYTSSVGRDLERLCLELLEVDPQRRAGGNEVLSVLAPRGQARASLPADSLPPLAPRFAGRSDELAELERVVRDVRQGAPRVVLVEGESGIGKTGLVSEFLRLLARRDPGAYVLRARCYENEALAYKAFDGAMDDLAQKLKRLDVKSCENLLPPRAGLLCRVFPVLGTVQALAHAPQRGVPADPNAQRLEAFRALFRLLEKLAESRLVVLSIDDLQWADLESFQLLELLLDDPHPPNLLIVATVRPGEELEGALGEAVLRIRQRTESRVLTLSGLPAESARMLARQLVPEAMSDSWIDGLARESRGHPLLLTVLARHAGTNDAHGRGEPSLALALDARLAGLEPRARALLDAVAVAGAPQLIEVFARAADLPPNEVMNLVAELCAQKLLRPRRVVELACFHDQIRLAVLRSLSPERTRLVHGRLARALLDVGGADPVALARHYDGAGDAARALHAYRRAAERAMDALGFAHAASLYRRAITLEGEMSADAVLRSELNVMLGHALSRAGRTVEAARAYLEAHACSPRDDQTHLVVWAAQHFLMGAAFTEGLSLATSLLDGLGLALPKNQGGALRRWMWDSLMSKLWGMPAQAPRRALEESERMRLEATWNLALPLAWMDPLRGSRLSHAHLHMALASGDPAHVARSLAIEAQRQAITHPNDLDAVNKLFERARIVASQVTDDESLSVFLTSREGTAAEFCMNLRAARSLLEQAERLSTERVPDDPWLLTNTRIGLGSAWANSAAHAQLAGHAGRWVAEARERDDRFAVAAHEGLGYGFMRHIMADQSDVASLSLDEAMAPWPEEPFSFVHFGTLIARAQIELYRGGDACFRFLDAERARSGNAILLRAGFGRPIYTMFRVLALLAARPVMPGRAASLLREATGLVKKIERVGSPFTDSTVPMLKAQLAVLAGQPEQAMQFVLTARTRSEAQHRWFLYHQVSYLEGRLEGGARGSDKRQAALAFFAAEGWRSPRRACAILCPILDELEAAQ